jgi:PmbA protein
MNESLLVIMAKASKLAQAAEVFLVSEEETPVRFEANRLKDIRSRESQSVALRVFKDGRIGYATSNNLADIDGLISDALETARFGAPANFELPSPVAYSPLDTFDPAVPEVPLSIMVAQGQEIITRLTHHTPGLLCEGHLSREVATVTILNSNGLTVTYRKSLYGLDMGGILTHGTDMLFVGDGQYSCQFFGETTSVADSIIRQLDWASTTASVPTRKMPAVFTPLGVASALLAPLIVGFNGKMVLEKASPCAEKLGKQALDNKFSLYDDVTLPYQPASRPFDDEGMPSRRVPLVDKGVVSHFFYDLKTAASAHTTSTGHGRRGRHEPEPAPGAFVIPAGSVSLCDMIADMQEGLVIEQLMGATQGNILGGDFSGNVLLGYKVEHGRIAGRIKNTVVFGNVYALLGNIAALGSDGRWVDGMLFTPSIFFPALSVASKE